MDGRTIYNRKRRLMALQRKIARARNRQLIGSETDVLVEGLSTETDLLWEGRMSTQAPEIDGVPLINDFEGAEPQAGRDPPPADHRSARLRSGGHATAGRARQRRRHERLFHWCRSYQPPAAKSPSPFYEVPDLPKESDQGEP